MKQSLCNTCMFTYLWIKADLGVEHFNRVTSTHTRIHKASAPQPAPRERKVLSAFLGQVPHLWSHSCACSFFLLHSCYEDHSAYEVLWTPQGTVLCNCNYHYWRQPRKPVGFSRSSYSAGLCLPLVGAVDRLLHRQSSPSARRHAYH